MEKSEGRDIVAEMSINPEDAQKLTKLMFTQKQWQRLVGDNEPYDPNKVFSGEPGADVEEGTMFKKVYDESGRYYGGTITGNRVEKTSKLPKK